MTPSRPRVYRASIWFFIAVAHAGCSDGSAPPPPSPEPCPDGGTRCGDTCLALDRDPENCGACDNACDDGTGCFAGRCESPAPMNRRRDGHALVLGPDGLIYAVGGSDMNEATALAPNPTPFVESYDPNTNQWTELPALPAPRLFLGACFRDDVLWAIGGGSIGPEECENGLIGDGCPRAEVWTLQGASWSPGPALSIPRVDFGMACATDGTFRAIGGVGPEQQAAIDVNADIAWGLVESPEDIGGRFGNRVVTAEDGKVYVLGGGLVDVFDIVGPIAIYDPASDAWTPGGSMVVPRALGAATLGLDGRIYYFGGTFAGSLGEALDTVEVYDPTTDTWSAGPPMPEKRVDTQAVTLPDGRMFIVGGSVFQFNNAVETVLVYDPERKQWYR